MKRNLEENHSHHVTKKVFKESHHVLLLLDLNYSSNLLATKIADIPQKLKYETILGPIFEFCFGTREQEVVFGKSMISFLEDENDDFNIKILNLKTDWIRDETFIYSQVLYLSEIKLNIVASKFGLWNNRKFIKNSCYSIHNALKYSNEEFRNDREFVMEILRERGGNIGYISEELRKDKEIVKQALKQEGSAIRFVSKDLEDDKEIVLLALESWVYAYKHASERLKNDRDVALKTVSHGVFSVGMISDKFKNDRELLLFSVKISGYCTLEFACSELRSDRDLVRQAVQKEPNAFELASDELKYDREFVKEMVMIDGECLRYACIEFIDDLEIVELALKSNPDAIHFISDRLRKDIDFISKLIGKRGFNQLPEEFSNDREIVLESIKLDRKNFNRASNKLQNDREFILQVVKICGLVISYLKEEFKSDEEIIIEAVKQNREVLKLVRIPAQCFEDEEIIIKAAQNTSNYANLSNFYNKLPDRLKNDREFHMKLGGFFEYFPRKYQLDREIVSGCLKTHPDWVLNIAYPFIVSDRVLALRIVKQNGLLLGNLLFNCRNDREIVSFAIQQNKKAFKYASDELQNDLEILKLYTS